MNALDALLHHLKQNQVQLRVEDNKIRFKDPNKIIKGDVLAQIKQYKTDIIALLQQNKPSGASTIAGTYKAGSPMVISKYQQSILFSEQISADSENFNLSLCFRFNQAIDADKMAQAVSLLVEQHSALRLGFIWQDGWQVQLNNSNDIVVEQVNLAELQPEQQLEQKFDVDGYALDFIGQPVHFDGRALFRAQFAQLSKDQGNDQSLLLIAVHHSVCDGISLTTLSQHLEQHYLALLDPQQQPPKAFAASYQDYLGWQTQQDHQPGLDYWQQALDGIPDSLPLPFDHVRPAQMSFGGDTHSIDLSPDLSAQLEQVSRSLGLTHFNLMLAAFSSLLSRYSGEQDIVTGVPFANRHLPETEAMVGLFINTLPIRSHLSADLDFKTLASQVAGKLGEATTHQQTPLIDIIEAVNPARSASYSPLFQVLVNYLDHSKDSSGSEFQQGLFFPTAQMAKYDVSLVIVNHAKRIECIFEYNSQLFNAQTIQRLAEHFSILLGKCLSEPEQLLSGHNILTEAEKAQNLRHNNSDFALPELLSPYQQLQQIALDTPDKMAVHFQHEALSYTQLNDKVDQLAHQLKSAGIGEGDRVGLYLLRSVEMVSAIYACFKLGAAYVPLDPAYPAQRIGHICQDAQPGCVLTVTALQSKAAELLIDCPVLNLDLNLDLNPDETVEAVTDNHPAVTVNPNSTAYLIYTSGTTGKPKGVEIGHGNLQNLLVSLDQTFEDDHQQVWLAQTSISFDISVVELIWTLSRGKTIVLQQSRPADLLKHQPKHQPKHQLKAKSRPLDFSIMFFSADDSQQNKYDLMLQSAGFADKNGFKAVWLPERHFAEFGGAFANPSITCAALSTITDNLQLRAGSVVLPLQDPIRVAEEWSMIDNLSQGRVGLAFASGWHPDDFVFSGCDFDNRHQQLKDKLVDVQQLWQGKSINRLNGRGQSQPVSIRPTPIQKQLPTWITAAGNPETFRYAGQIGANILTHVLGQSLDQLISNIGVYHDALTEHGFSVDDKDITLMLHSYLDSTDDIALSIVETPFKNYLKSSLNLMAPLAKEIGLDMAEHQQQIIDLAFERFSKANALFGTASSCQGLLERLHQAGITEIANLIDFGVASDKVMSSLQHLTVAQQQHSDQWQLSQQLNAVTYQTELDLIDQHNISHVQMTPSQLKVLLETQKGSQKQVQSVKHWLIGGEPLSVDVLTNLAQMSDGKTWNMYGPTETTVWSAWSEVSEQSVHIGQPILNTQFLLLDHQQQPVPTGVCGQLYIGGLGVAGGYWQKPELTDEYFTANPAANTSKEGRFYRTGDLMRLNDSGSYDYLGRVDDQIKISGYRIEQKEIESVIGQLNGIKDCKVVVKRQDDRPPHLAAYVVQNSIVAGEYVELPADKQAKPFTFSDGSLVYHQNDRQLGALFQEIFTDDVYFKHGIELEPGAFVMDVGANVGSFSIAANQREPSVTILAFEPIPPTFSALKKNFEHRQINGRVFNYGISNKIETATFSYYENMSGLSGRFADLETEKAAAKVMIDQSGTALELSESEKDQQVEQYLQTIYASEDIECQLTTISDVIDQQNISHIDLLKVDIEKSECLALQGIRDEHWPKIKQIALEVDGDEHLMFIRETLLKHGFEVIADDFIKQEAEEHGELHVYMVYGHNRRFIKPEPEQINQYSAHLNESQIKHQLIEHLPEFMVPSEIQFLEQIPLLKNGKLDQQQLKLLSSEAQVSELKNEHRQAASSEQEIHISGMWDEILNKTASPVDISFFEFGGTSLEVVKLHSRLQNEFAIELSIIDLFRHTTISDQVALINAADSKTTDDLADNSAKQAAKQKGAARRQSTQGRRRKSAKTSSKQEG